MTEKTFPNWLRKQLRSREWTQSDFARRMGVGTGTVSRWMSGRQPDTRYCDLIADVLGEDVDVVLTLAGHRPEITPLVPDDPKTRLIATIRRADLNEERASYLLGLLEEMQRYPLEPR